MATIPTKKEIRRFIEVVDKLSKFEAEQRTIRGWGAWSERTDTLPIPEAITVMNWLKDLAEEN
jgi:hypothetical protein